MSRPASGPGRYGPGVELVPEHLIGTASEDDPEADPWVGQEFAPVLETGHGLVF